MTYIITKRFKRKGIDGDFNIPYGTEIESRDGYLRQDGKRICSEKSAVMREYFARDNDTSTKSRVESSTALLIPF